MLIDSAQELTIIMPAREQQRVNIILLSGEVLPRKSQESTARPLPCKNQAMEIMLIFSLMTTSMFTLQFYLIQVCWAIWWIFTNSHYKAWIKLWVAIESKSFQALPKKYMKINFSW